MPEWVWKCCPICGVNYCLDKIFDQHREKGAKGRDGSKLGWYCPNGHQLVYTESEADRLRRERDRLQQQIAQRDDEIKDLENRRRAAVGQVTKLRKRASAGTCPCCQRTFSNMAQHMKRQHPDFVTELGAKVVPIKVA